MKGGFVRCSISPINCKCCWIARGAFSRRMSRPRRRLKDRSVRTGGMGIGLSLVSQSVTAAGGDIEVSSRASGGAEFRVRLPMTPIDMGVLR